MYPESSSPISNTGIKECLYKRCIDYILAGEHAISDSGDPEIERVKENIMGPLSACSLEQLKCMEQIARYYVEGIVGGEE